MGFPQYLSFPPKPQRLQLGHQILGILPTIQYHLAFQLQKRQHKPTVLSNKKARGTVAVPGGRLWAGPAPEGPGGDRPLQGILTPCGQAGTRPKEGPGRGPEARCPSRVFAASELASLFWMKPQTLSLSLGK